MCDEITVISVIHRLNSLSWLPPEETVNQWDTHAHQTGIPSLVGVMKTLTEGTYTEVTVTNNFIFGPSVMTGIKTN